MPKPITALDHGRRLERAARYIAANLDAMPTLERFAGVANFSVFHFHRIYREATGETVRLAALRHTGSYMDIGGSFERLIALAAPRGLVGPDSQCVGRYYDDSESVATSALRSDACVTLPAGAMPEGALQLIQQPACRCAIVRHRGPYAELEPAYRWLFRTWLPQSGEQPDDQPCFELYLDDPRQLPPTEWLTDVCLPLKRR